MVVARQDKNWRLISFSYFTKKVLHSNETGFKYIDLMVPKLLASGHSYQLIKTTVLLENEDEKGCTLIVLSFHKNIAEW